MDLKYIRPSNALNMSKIVQISTLNCCFPNHAVLLDINHAMTANTVQQNRLYVYHGFFPAHVCTICSYIALALSDLTSSLPGHSGLLPPLPPLDSHRAGAICGCRSSKGARHSPGAVYGPDKCKIIQWNPIETILLAAPCTKEVQTQTEYTDTAYLCIRTLQQPATTCCHSTTNVSPPKTCWIQTCNLSIRVARAINLVKISKAYWRVLGPVDWQTVSFIVWFDLR